MLLLPAYMIAMILEKEASGLFAIGT